MIVLISFEGSSFDYSNFKTWKKFFYYIGSNESNFFLIM